MRASGVVVPIERNRSEMHGRGGDLVGRKRGDSYSKRRDRRYACPVARASTVARLGAAVGCGLLLAGTLASCGGTKTVTKTVTVVGTVPNGGATSVSASVAAGAHDFTQFACAQCHGERGRGGVSTDVPALNVIGKQLTVAQLKQIINHGLGESANPTKPYMPVWGQVISTHQVADLVAYIRAGLPSVPGATPAPVITGQGPAVEGALLYQRYGCVNCHGPNGLGGVANPQSPDKAIPALSGADFFKEFNTDEKIIEIIRTGSVLGRAPIVSMPHWGGIIPDSQLRALVAYVKTLKTG
jgi:cbb3-type cytochrome c oxidase subunit III